MGTFIHFGNIVCHEAFSFKNDETTLTLINFKIHLGRVWCCNSYITNGVLIRNFHHKHFHNWNFSRSYITDKYKGSLNFYRLHLILKMEWCRRKKAFNLKFLKSSIYQSIDVIMSTCLFRIAINGKHFVFYTVHTTIALFCSPFSMWARILRITSIVKLSKRKNLCMSQWKFLVLFHGKFFINWDFHAI